MSNSADGTSGGAPAPAEYTGYAGAGIGDAVLYEERDDIAFITINNGPLNRFDEAVTNGLHDAWLRFAESEARVALLTAKGDAFRSGGNAWRRALDVWWCFPGLGVSLDKPVVAAVHGSVIGTGLSLVAFCDLVVAADNTTFSYPEPKAGIAGGVAASLASRIPAKIATELLLIGEPIDAQRAYEVGLINKVVPLGQERQAALGYAQALAANAPRCVRMMKRFIGETLAKSPPEAGAIARAAITDVVFSEDSREYFRAASEGRTPRFTGN